MIVVGVDTGGTFTDLIFQVDAEAPEGGRWLVHKLLSTPDNPARAVLEGLAVAVGDRPKQIVHGSTVATNAILERKGVKTALVTNRNFTDIIVIGRQNRSRLYDLAYRREPPIVPKELRFGVPGRILHDGREHEPFDDDAALAVAEKLKEAGVESIAVSFLFSFVNSAHELRMEEILSQLALPVSLSHRVLAEFREFERTSTTVVNAYVSPKMHHYLSHLLKHLREEDALRIMQSNGGSISAETAMVESVRTILSGPAGGVVGAFEIGRLAGFDRLISFDMGGTSTDVSLIDGGLSLTTETVISGYPVKTPMIDIHTVGAGGGSIAAVDVGGSLTVGPESAGADPGPICYGRGERITVTDANLFLGRLVPEHFLGGHMRLYENRIIPFFSELSDRMGMKPEQLAEGIIAIANSNMERAIRVISVERGFDPREFTLFSFGGAGGLHAAYLARLLNIPRVLIPKNPGILSAIGMLMADVIKDYSQTVMLKADSIDAATLERTFVPLEQKARAELHQEGIVRDRVSLERYVDVRYEGQSYEIMTPFSGDFLESFQALHEKAYGYRMDKPAEIVNVRLRARGTPKKPVFREEPLAGRNPPESARLGKRSVIFEGSEMETELYQRENLLPGNCIEGPAVVVEYSSTTLLPPFVQGRVDGFGNIILEMR